VLLRAIRDHILKQRFQVAQSNGLASSVLYAYRNRFNRPCVSPPKKPAEVHPNITPANTPITNYADSPTHYFYQRPYEIYQLTLGFKIEVAKRWTKVQLTVNNVFDSEVYCQQSYRTGKNGGPEFAMSFWIQPPRQFVFRTTCEF
jgi:hypothetical protein